MRHIALLESKMDLNLLKVLFVEGFFFTLRYVAVVLAAGGGCSNAVD